MLGGTLTMKKQSPSVSLTKQQSTKEHKQPFPSRGGKRTLGCALAKALELSRFWDQHWTSHDTAKNVAIWLWVQSLRTDPTPRKLDFATSQFAPLAVLNVTNWKSVFFAALKAQNGKFVLCCHRQPLFQSNEEEVISQAALKHSVDKKRWTLCWGLDAMKKHKFTLTIRTHLSYL